MVASLVWMILPGNSLGQDAGDTSQLKNAARESFAAGDMAKGREQLTRLRNLYQQTSAGNQSTRGRYRWSAQLAEIAQECLRVGELSGALDVLGEAAELNVPLRNGYDNGLAGAAGGLHRQLVQLDAEERFDALYEWSMPTESRRTIRVLRSIVPTEAPPAVFARALGERPRDTSFSISSVGEVEGLFSSAWLLVLAAEDTGRLTRLTRELTELSEQQIAGADAVLTLATILDADEHDEQFSKKVEQHLADLKQQSGGQTTTPGSFDHYDIWKFGYFDAGVDPAEAEFKPLPYWNGSGWQGAAEIPSSRLGWLRIDKEGGHPEQKFSAVRRWMAPEDGTVIVIGDLQHSADEGDGVRGRLVSSRSGVAGEWTAFNGSTATAVGALAVKAGDTIDFVTDKVDTAAFDHFEWIARIQMQVEGQLIFFDSVSGFHGPQKSDPLGDAVLAAACLEREWLQPIGEEILQKLIEDSYGSESWLLRPFLRRAQAIAVRKRYPDANRDLITDSSLQYWVASSGYHSAQSAQGVPQDVWLAQEDHILHLSGPGDDSLLFRYPLTGEFEFSCQAQDGGRGGTEGGVMYGGLGYEAWGAGQSFKVWDADYRFEVLRPCPFVHVEGGRSVFNRLSLKSTDDGVTFLSNGHAVWTDSSNDRSSPWIGLRCFNDRRPVFRNLRITGKPVIPREVRLIEGDRLCGWLAAYYNETVPTSLPEQNRRSSYVALPRETNDWHTDEGVLHGAKRDANSTGESQSRLYYVRPLLNGESVSYEFQYEPDRFEVHPTLGRLAFLVEPNGVRLHWLTDGDREWTGLAEDNAVVEPFNRRGPRELPLKPGDRNRATLAMADGKATLSLNGKQVYQRAIESENDRRFGFYHDRHQSAVRVRNVVMQGDWPEHLPDDLLTDLAAMNQDRSPADRHAINELLGDSFVAENVFALRRRIASVPSEEQYKSLVEWVLPGQNHASYRLAGAFTATHPVPSLADDDATDRSRLARATEAGEARAEIGGNLVSPVFDLIRTAQQLDRLDDLRQRLAHAAANDDNAERSGIALLLLVDLAQKKFDRASERFAKLLSLGEGVDHSSDATCWPEALAVSQGILHAETRATATELLRSFYSPRLGIWQKNGSDAWNNYIASLAGLSNYLGQEDASLGQFWTASDLKNWKPAGYTTSRTRGAGRVRAAWHRSGHQVENLSGHEQDYLFYRIPLRGNYEVECDVTSFGWRESHLMVAGTVVAPAYLRMYGVGDFRRVVNRGKIDPMLSKVEDWIRYRAVVRDGVSTTYFNGRKIHEQQLGDNNDPWLAIRSWSRHQGAVRNLRISGDPVVPEQIDLSARPDLAGWSSYFGVTVGEAASDWHHVADGNGSGGIVGKCWRDLAGSGLQRLLRYHRPMIEDGTIEYEFFYQPGEVATHPTLDRLAFILDPEGVRIHWVTDGRYDKTDLSPMNLFDEPEHRLGPDKLPLKVNEWNKMRFILRGDTVGIALNDQPVYRRDLEPTNQRTFGLFHFGGDTEARVRNVVWRGDWPREVPEMAKQELAGDGAEFLDERVAELNAVFEHDFAKDGLPEESFLFYGADSERRISSSEEGTQVTRPGIGAWSQASFGPRIRARGDFDMTATFDRLDTKNVATVNIMMLAILESEVSHHCRTTRSHHSNGHQTINAQLFTITPDGGRRLQGKQEISEASAGRLRIARRGDMVYFLLAENDSPIFRIIGQEEATADDIRSNGIRLVASAGEGAQVNVVWKDISIRAEQLMFIPKELDTPVLFVMRADGQGVRQLTKPIGNLGSHGSPAWSPDGKRVAFDTYGGSTATSHIYTISADGTDLKDLGIGSMPTYSPDGKRIAFSWSGRGITVMDADGENREVLDTSGWGAQWSPDGKSIAYGARTVTVLDLETKKQRTILEGEQARRYGYIYWNMAWSLDSKYICFMGRSRDGTKVDIVAVDAAGSSRGFKILHTLDKQIHADFSWHPDGKQILCSMHNPQLEGPRIYTLDFDNPGPPKLFPTQPLDQNSTSSDWTRDGKHIVFSSQRLPKWNDP
jgi:Tol biopolymer transport system component